MNDALPPQHTKAMQIVADANENIARIRARTDLVPEAKAQRIAGVYLDATGKLDPLRAEYEAGETNRLARLQRKAFALPLGDSMAAASYRDALDRFGRLRDEDGGRTPKNRRWSSSSVRPAPGTSWRSAPPPTSASTGSGPRPRRAPANWSRRSPSTCRRWPTTGAPGCTAGSVTTRCSAWPSPTSCDMSI